MKKFSILIFCIFNVILGFSQSELHSTKVSIGANNFVIASFVASNKDVYVFTAPESGDFDEGRYKTKGKVTLWHYDPNDKLVLKKVLTLPMVNGAKFLIEDAFEVGQKIVAVGTAETKKGHCTTGYVTIDLKTLVASKKVISLMENNFEISFGFSQSRNNLSFSQIASGKPLGIYVSYSTPKERTGKYGSRLAYHAHYFLIDEEGLMTDVFKYDCATEETDRSHEGFVMGNDGNMYILTTSSPHYEYDWEKHEITKDSKERLINGDFITTLTIFNSQSKSKKNIDVKFSDNTLFIDYCLLKNYPTGVYIIGTCSNIAYNYRQNLKGDTSAMTNSRYIFTLQASEDLRSVPSTSLGLVNQELYDQLTTEKSLTDMDREIGNCENATLIDCIRLEDGTAVFTYAIYVYWNWPPYEKIKNDSRYTFEKDDEGHVFSSSGPPEERKAEFKSILTIKFNPATKDVSMSTQAITLNMTMDFMQHRPNTYEMFFGRVEGNEYVTYYVQPQGSSSRMLSSHPSEGNATITNSSESMTFARSTKYTIQNSVLVVSGKGDFQVIRLE